MKSQQNLETLSPSEPWPSKRPSRIEVALERTRQLSWQTLMDWPRGSMPGRTQEETQYLACVQSSMREFSLVGSVTWNKLMLWPIVLPFGDLDFMITLP